jgi:hypothetical protein
MKNIFLTIVLIILTLGITGPVSAAIISFGENRINVKTGDVFNLEILLAPQNEKIFTVKAALFFPTSLLEMERIRWNDRWIILPTENYNLTANETQTAYLTAGYPGGTDQPTDLATVIFKAKTTGSGNIGISGDSLALNLLNLDSFNAPYPTIPVVVIAPEAVLKTPVAAALPAQTPPRGEQVSPVAATPPQAQETLPQSPPSSFPPLFDVSISPVKTPPGPNLIILIIVELIFIVFAGIIAARYEWRQKKRIVKI